MTSFKFSVLNILFLLTCSYSIIGLSQTEEQYLLIESRKDIIVKEGKPIRLKLDNDNVVSGRLAIVDDSTLLIDDQKIAMQSISKIRLPSRLNQVLGGFFTAGGLAVNIVGITLLYHGYHANPNWNEPLIITAEAIGGVILIALGLGITALGTITTVAGVTTMFIGKKYRVAEGKSKISIAHRLE